MLGLGSSIISTSPAANRFENVKSLILDGSGDYIDTRNTFQSTFRGSFSWSFWIKPDDGQPGATENLLGCDNADDTDAFFITLDTAGKIKIDHEANNDPASYITDAAVYADGAGGWKHICVTVTKATNTSYIIYVDGAAVAGTLSDAVAEAAHAAWTSVEHVYIGATDDDGSALNPFTGKMDEVALFNVALDADAVAAIYNSGTIFDLNEDKGNYDNSSALVVYYRMFDDVGAGDDKADDGLIIHDAHDPGLGAELVDATPATAHIVGNGANVVEIEDGAYKVTFDGGTASGGELRFRDTDGPLSTDLTVGKIYKVQFEMKINTGAMKPRVYAGGNINAVEGTTFTSTSYLLRTIYFPCNNTTNNALTMQADFGTGEIYFIKNLSLKELNGIPALSSGNPASSTDVP